MGSCPERIISFNNYSVDMIGSMIKSIHVPEEYDEKPANPRLDLRERLFSCRGYGRDAQAAISAMDPFHSFEVPGFLESGLDCGCTF